MTVNPSRPSDDDEARLAALDRYRIVDTPPEEAYDDIARLAATICAAPIALINFIGADRQWFKAAIGLDRADEPPPLGVSICAAAIREGGLFLVPDLRNDPRFAENPLVAGPARLRSYAGAVLTTPDGHAIGTICVLDHVPRTLTDAQKDALAALGRQTVGQLELRRALADATVEIAERSRVEEALRRSSERLSLALEASRMGDWSWDAATDVVTFSERAAAIFGIPPGPFMTWTAMRRLLHPDDRQRARRAVERAIAEHGDFDIEYRVARPDGGEVWVGLKGRAQYRPDGAVLGMIGVLQDVTARRRAEADLRESEQRLALAVQATRLGLWDYDPVERRLESTSQARALVGLPADRPATYDAWLARVHPEDRDAAHAAVLKALDPAGEGEYRLDYRIILPTGEIRWIAATGQTIFEGEGAGRRAVRMIGTRLDITGRKSDEAHLRLLLGELSHRVKNTLATVQSIATQTLRTTASPALFREAFTARLLALSHTHNLLTRSDWQGAGLRDVLMAELTPHLNRSAPRIDMTGEDVLLSPRTSLALGMAFHELATNAAKYGALSTPSGRVSVAWTLNGAGRRLHLTWTEAGGPPVAAPSRKGFGSMLIQRGLAHEVDAEVDLAFPPEGVQCTIALPLTVGGSARMEPT